MKTACGCALVFMLMACGGIEAPTEDHTGKGDDNGGRGWASRPVQDAVWQKTYCLDSQGTIIDFAYEDGVVPRGTGEAGAAHMVGDSLWLRSLPPLTATFLFTRACFEAARIKQDAPSTEALECEAARFMMARLKTGPTDIVEITVALGEYDDTREMARTLHTCP